MANPKNNTPFRRNRPQLDAEALEIRNKTIGSFLTFCRTFYLLRTGRKFEMSEPPGRESHYITIAKALTRVLKGECNRLLINVCPRYGKSEMLIHFAAWAMAQYPDSNFIYTSYAHSLAKKQTQTIRDIMRTPEFRVMYDVMLKDDSTAKDNFETTAGGSVYAVGAGGAITGRGAGIKGCDRFGGAIIIDDIHKPDEVMSDTVREGINEWYFNTLQSRVNSPATPIIFIGQRLHEDDLAARLLGMEGWESVIIPAIDEAGNPLHPQMHDLKALRMLEQLSPYVFASQYQQDPQPAGGGIFKPEWFLLHEFEPEILTTFITADTAETDKEYNDATVFSFWGLYRIKHGDTVTDEYALHWIDCHETRIEPKDLENEFMQFYARCMRHRVKPKVVAIEKKSTGTTLVSVLKKYQGMQVVDIERNRASGSKMQRFMEVQPYVAAQQVSLPEYGRHTQKCIEHMRKITANDTHKHDDIADTMADAVRIALIDKTVMYRAGVTRTHATQARALYKNYDRIEQLKRKAYQ